MTVEKSQLEKTAEEFAQHMAPRIIELGKGLPIERLLNRATLEAISARLGYELGMKEVTKAEKKAELDYNSAKKSKETIALVVETVDRLQRSFKESVLLCEENQKTISIRDSKRILTVRALYDETVPILTTTILGARNDQIFSIGHVFSIALSMTFLSRKCLIVINYSKDDIKIKSKI